MSIKSQTVKLRNEQQININVEAIIKKAVNEGMQAGRLQAEQVVKDIYKATERRLYALPDLRNLIETQKEHLEDMRTHGLQGHSKDIARFQRSGIRLCDDDLLEALIKDKMASIAANEHEIKVIEDALEPLISDEYYLALSGRYFEGLSDEEIAKHIPCDPRTVRRNRGRLVRRVAVRLYGAQAVS